jgi:hypothetical protein
MGSARHAFGQRNCCGIAIMGKASAPGRTKTRLVPPLTGQEAAAFNTAIVALEMTRADFGTAPTWSEGSRRIKPSRSRSPGDDYQCGRLLFLS